MGFGLSLTFGILYWFATNKLWYGWLHLTRQPLVLAIPIGLIMGDLSNSMKIGAALQLIYLGAIAPGGTLPSDEALASCITIPLALYAGLSPELAVPIAMPLGILGVFLDNLKRTYHSVFVRGADRAAEEINISSLKKNTLLYPLLVSIPLRIIPVTLGLYYGVDAIQSFLASLPDWAMHGLTVAGGILPALGFAVTIVVIGKKTLLPYFVLGFAISAYSGINMIGLAIFAICIAVIQSHLANQNKSTQHDLVDANGELQKKNSTVIEDDYDDGGDF